jgi:hypothetical protein
MVFKALKKLKSLEEPNEYCLVEQIESEIQPSKSTSDSKANSTLNNSNQNINNYSKNTTQSTHTTGTLSTTLSSYIKTNSSSLSGGTNSSNKSKLITKTRVLNPNDNLNELTNVWAKMKLEKKDGFKQAKVILVKKKALQTPNSLNSLSSANKHSSHHSKISASFAKVAAKSSNLHNIFSASLASANLTYFNSPHASSSNTNQYAKSKEVVAGSSSSALNPNNRTKSSSNRLVRQQSFDDTYDTLTNDKIKSKRETNVKKQHTSSEATYSSTLATGRSGVIPPPPPPLPLLSTLFKSKLPTKAETVVATCSETTLKNTNEINESKSKLALSTEIHSQKNDLNEEDDEDDYEDEENEFEDEENKDDYQLIQAEVFSNILNEKFEETKGEINEVENEKGSDDIEQKNQDFSTVKHEENEALETLTQASEPSELNDSKNQKNRSTLKRLFNMKF